MASSVCQPSGADGVVVAAQVLEVVADVEIRRAEHLVARAALGAYRLKRLGHELVELLVPAGEAPVGAEVKAVYALVRHKESVADEVEPAVYVDKAVGILHSALRLQTERQRLRAVGSGVQVGRSSGGRAEIFNARELAYQLRSSGARERLVSRHLREQAGAKAPSRAWAKSEAVTLSSSPSSPASKSDAKIASAPAAASSPVMRAPGRAKPFSSHSSQGLHVPARKRRGYQRGVGRVGEQGRLRSASFPSESSQQIKRFPSPAASRAETSAASPGRSLNSVTVPSTVSERVLRVNTPIDAATHSADTAAAPMMTAAASNSFFIPTFSPVCKS